MKKISKTAVLFFVALIGPFCLDAFMLSFSTAVTGVDAENEAKLNALPDGEDLLPSGIEAFYLSGVSKGYASMSTNPVSGMPFDEVLRITSLVETEHGYDIQLKSLIGVEVEEGDLLLLTFYGRSIYSTDESGVGSVLPLYEKYGSPYTKSLYTSVGLETGWKKFYLSFEVRVDDADGDSYPAYGSKLAFNLGFEPQQIELADICLVRYPSTVSLDDMPYTIADYEGSEDDAEWRTEALARIDEIRKANLQVSVVDADGLPVSNAVVNVEMTEHQFRFGTAINAWMVARGDEDTAIYLEKIKENFNQVTPESTLKWMRWPEYKDIADATVQWAVTNGLTVRGHTTVWPSWAKSPYADDTNEIAYLETNPEELRTRINDHIEDITTAYQGDCIDWDVLNEPYNNTNFMDVLGQDSMMEWFELVQQYDSDTRLCINDFGILTNGEDLDTDHMQAYEDTISYLLTNGAPLQAIGMQGHFQEVMTAPANLLEIFDRFSQFDLPLLVTEFDHRTSNQETQAMYMRDILIAAFSHPAVDTFMMWGLWDAMHWSDNAPLYEDDWSLKPGGEVYQYYVLDQWWTREEGETDSDGSYSVRGFMGDYEITVTTDTSTNSLTLTLPDAGTSVEVMLP